MTDGGFAIDPEGKLFEQGLSVQYVIASFF